MLIRALIVLLLVLNLGVAAWWLWSAPPSAGPSVALPANVARLQLVRERGVGTTGTAAVPFAAPADAEAAAAATAASDAPPANATAADAPADGAETPATAVAPQAPVSPADNGRCYSYGPFDSEDMLVAAQATLKPLSAALVVRRMPLRAGRGWRVFLPPLANAEEATAAAGRISAAGFRDYFIVREGAEANSVALGRFGSEAAARRHAEALNAAGFAARAEPLGAGTGSAWVDVRAGEGFDAAAARAQAGASQVRPTDCATLR